MVRPRDTNWFWYLKPLKKQYRGEFLMPASVKSELIDRPLKSKKFKLESFTELSNWLKNFRIDPHS